jgi:lipopolysaccharide assembly outer membrane protein LptD (OstA)
LVLIAFGGVALGQGAGPSKPLTRIIYGPKTEINAKELRYEAEERTVYARGAVRIVSESSTITADEADVHLLRSTREAVDLDVSLRGNVRVLVTPLNGGIR